MRKVKVWEYMWTNEVKNAEVVDKTTGTVYAYNLNKTPYNYSVAQAEVNEVVDGKIIVERIPDLWGRC